MSKQTKENKGNENKKEMEDKGGKVLVFNEYETAKLLGVSVHALRKWRFEGRGPAYVKQGVRVGYLEEDLTAYLQAVRVEPRQQ